MVTKLDKSFCFIFLFVFLALTVQKNTSFSENQTNQIFRLNSAQTNLRTCAKRKQKTVHCHGQLNMDCSNIVLACEGFKVGRSRHEGSCSRDMLQERVAGTKSQPKHTDENNAATCFSDILQRHVPSCELTLL